MKRSQIRVLGEAVGGLIMIGFVPLAIVMLLSHVLRM